jgi:hypothetical protein
MLKLYLKWENKWKNISRLGKMLIWIIKKIIKIIRINRISWWIKK